MDTTEKAVPGTVVPTGNLVTPGGAQGVQGLQGTTALADATQNGLLRQVSGNTTDFIDGTNNSQPLQPVIWSARLRSFNAIGNPTFEVDQKNVGTSVAIGVNTALIDRWRAGGNGTWGATAQQKSAVGSELVVPGTNFQISRSYLRITLTTAQATLGASDSMWIGANVEGPMFRELQFDVHSCQLLVRSSVAGLKFGLAFQDAQATTKSLVKLCTLPSTSWTLISLPNLPIFPSAGNFSNLAGAVGYVPSITLAAGSTLTVAANDTWQNSTAYGAVGQSNFASNSVGSTFDVAFVQHEPGALCTTPIDCPFTENYESVLRYFSKTQRYTSKPGTASDFPGANATFWVDSATVANGYGPYKKPMATSPTVTLYNPNTGAAGSAYNVVSGAAIAGVSAGFVGDNGFEYLAGSGLTVGAHLSVHYTADTNL